MQIDEFSRNELRESHATIQELTSQAQERKNCKNGSEEISRCGVDLQWKIISRSQPAVVPSPRGMLSRDQSL